MLRSESMWREHAVDVGELTGVENELVIVCRALAPLMASAAVPRPGGGPASSTTATSAGTGRWCSAARQGSRRRRRRSDPGGRSGSRRRRRSPEIAVRPGSTDRPGSSGSRAAASGRGPRDRRRRRRAARRMRPRRRRSVAGRAEDRRRRAVVAAHPRRADAARSGDIGRRRDRGDAPDRVPHTPLPGRHPVRRARRWRSTASRSSSGARSGRRPTWCRWRRPTTRCARCSSGFATRG